MRYATTALLAVFVSSGCGGSKKDSADSKSTKPTGPDLKDCRVIGTRNVQCLDVLVPMAERSARRLMEKTLERVDEPERAQLKAKMLKAIEAQRPELKKTLKEGLKEPFMKWCTQAHRSQEQARVLAKVRDCLKETDCAGYAQCLGGIMETLQDRLLTRTPRPVARPASR